MATKNVDKLLVLAGAHFEPDEEPLSTIFGLYSAGSRSGILVATNLRVIFYCKKRSGHDLETLSYSDLSDIEGVTRWVRSSVRFRESGQERTMKWISDGDAQEFAATVKALLGAAAPAAYAPNTEPAVRSGAPASAVSERERPNPASAENRPPTLETAILRVAAANGGSITPAMVAVDGEYTLRQCEEYLQKLVNKEYARVTVRDSGAIYYTFPELLGAAGSLAPAVPEQATAGASLPAPPRPATPDRRRPVRATRKPRWISARESVTVAGYELGGMIYVGRGPLVNGEPDNAFIDPTKPVAARADDLGAEGMDYWPNYSFIHPRSRATYLAWLAGGRSDPDVNVGYVFLYFYGLERRFFADEAESSERDEIVVEVERLRRTYGSNRSANSYLGSFLQAARAVVGEESDWIPVFEEPGVEVPITVRLAIGCMLQDGKPIAAEWMLCWLVTHPDRQLRMPARRAFPEFKALFEIRFRERFPAGIKIAVPNRKMSLSYRAASTNFDVDITPRISGRDIPDISHISRPLDQVSQIADEVIGELDKFSRYLGRNPDGRGTIEAHALLPEPLHGLFPCPQLDEMKAWAQHHVAHGGLVSATDLIERLEGARPEKIGKRQLTGAADALGRLSIGMAPDPRFALRSPKPGEPVILFSLPSGITRLEDVSGHYPPALLSLVMGTFIAHADGTVSEMERRHLIERFMSSKVLSASEKARLQANLDWMMAVPPDLGPIRRRIREIGDEVRHGLGRLALAVVGADGVVDPAEIKAIHKLFRILDIEADGIDRDLHALAAAPEPVTGRQQTAAPDNAMPLPEPERASTAEPGPIVLDRRRVAELMEDTVEVSNLLHAVFTENGDNAEGEQPDAAADPGDRFAGLDGRHRGFAEELMRQRSWTPQQFEKLARQFGLMPLGAIETINEWAVERHGAGMIDQDEEFKVNLEVGPPAS